jgi:hypothetical protein
MGVNARVERKRSPQAGQTLLSLDWRTASLRDTVKSNGLKAYIAENEDKLREGGATSLHRRHFGNAGTPTRASLGLITYRLGA